MKRALVVGIDHYDSGGALNGCVSDAVAIEKLIARHHDGSKNFDTKLVSAPPGQGITASNLRSLLNELLTSPADMAFFYFSGHGTATNMGGYLCTSDAKQYNEGVSMQDLLTLVNNATTIKEIIVMLDCCHSGAMGAIPALGNATTHIKEGVSILTASRDSEAAMMSNGTSIFTSLVCDALSGSAADLKGVVTPAGVYAHVEQSFGAWDQRPLFKSHVSRSTPLRHTKPKVADALLRELPSLFGTAATAFQLDRTYEKTEATAKKENVAIFEKLKSLQTVGLIHVNRVDDQHLYWACLNNESCELTALGRFCWHLAKSGKI